MWRHETVCRKGWLNVIQCLNTLTFDLLAHPQGWSKGWTKILRWGPGLRQNQNTPPSRSLLRNQQQVSNIARPSSGACFCPRWHAECSPQIISEFSWQRLGLPRLPAPLLLADLCYKIRGSGIMSVWQLKNEQRSRCRVLQIPWIIHGHLQPRAVQDFHPTPRRSIWSHMFLVAEPCCQRPAIRHGAHVWCKRPNKCYLGPRSAEPRSAVAPSALSSHKGGCL